MITRNCTGPVYVNGTAIAEVIGVQVMGEPRASAATETATNPLPKPARVEKWQRWRDSRGVEFTVIGPREDVLNTDIYPLRKDGEEGSWRGNNLLGGKNWTFLGYAKPDNVEVGQRWRSKTCVYDVRRKMAHPRRDDVWELLGEDRVAMDSTETEIRGWEYLGMAESAEASNQEAESVKRDVAELQQRMLVGDNHATFAPTFRGMPFPNQGRIQVDSARHPTVQAAKIDYATADDWKAPPVQTKQTADQARQDDRRANEEAAKRLIENPPEWAYPTAWGCAVLALQERANVDAHRIFSTSGDKICAEMLLEECERAHKRQPRISGVVYDPIRDVLFDAYARGMERPTLLGRPGVKGGISTCDVGVEYE